MCEGYPRGAVALPLMHRIQGSGGNSVRFDGVGEYRHYEKFAEGLGNYRQGAAGG